MTARFSNILSSLNGLSAHHRIAMILWCMERAFTLLDATTLVARGYDFRRLRRTSMGLWAGPGPTWSAEYLEGLRGLCEEYNSEVVRIVATDDRILGLLYSDPQLVREDHIYNALTDTVAIAYASTGLIPAADTENVVQAMESYYDIFYQPTWDKLTEGKSVVTPPEMALVRQAQDSAEPLRTALEQVDLHLRLLSGIETISFNDVRLRPVLKA